MVPLTTIFSLFTGSSWAKWIGIGLVMLCLVAACAWLKLDNSNLKADLVAAHADTASVQAAYDQSQVVIDALQDAIATKDKALAERETTINTINADREAMRRRWQEAIRNDSEAREWGAMRLPDAVRGLLQ